MKTAVFCFGVLLLASTQLLADSISDNFDDNVINPAIWNSWSVGTGVSIVESNQQIETRFLPGANNGGLSYAAGITGDTHLSGDFDISVDYTIISSSPSGLRAALTVNGLQGSGPYFGPRRASNVDNTLPPTLPNEYYCMKNGPQWLEFTETADVSGSLRLARTGDQMTGYYLGPSDWVPIATVTQPVEEYRFFICAWAPAERVADGEVTVTFDNFAMTYTNTVPTPSSIAALLGMGLTGMCPFCKRAFCSPGS